MDAPALSTDYEDVCAATLLDSSRSLTDDRVAEVAEFLGHSPEAMWTIYEEYNVHKTKRPPKFDDSNLASIIESYVNKDTLDAHLSRLMIKYTRLEMASALLRGMTKIWSGRDKSEIEVCDYGCGAADFGLAFAVNGYNVTLVDLDGGKIEFAKWRFERRGIPVKTIGVNEAHEYPDFAGLDLVMAGDVLEHLRDPREAISRVHAGLNPGGHFWFPDFPFKEKSIGGDHLVSAATLREEAADLVRKLFEPANVMKHLMRKRS